MPAPKDEQPGLAVRGIARGRSRERLNNRTYSSATFTGNSNGKSRSPEGNRRRATPVSFPSTRTKRRSGELVKGLFIPPRCRAWLRLFAVDLIESRFEQEHVSLDALEPLVQLGVRELDQRSDFLELANDLLPEISHLFAELLELLPHPTELLAQPHLPFREKPNIRADIAPQFLEVLANSVHLPVKRRVALRNETDVRPEAVRNHAEVALDIFHLVVSHGSSPIINPARRNQPAATSRRNRTSTVASNRDCRGLVVWGTRVTSDRSSPMKGTLRTRQGRTFAARPRSVSQTSPRRGSAIQGFALVKLGEE